MRICVISVFILYDNVNVIIGYYKYQRGASLFFKGYFNNFQCCLDNMISGALHLFIEQQNFLNKVPKPRMRSLDTECAQSVL